jgi:hypothetical protein
MLVASRTSAVPSTNLIIRSSISSAANFSDNGKQLPLWKDLPHFMYWLIPIAVGIPLIVRVLLWPPLARAENSA